MWVYCLYVMEAIDQSGYESAKYDALGIVMCISCGCNRVHSPSSDLCVRCASGC